MSLLSERFVEKQKAHVDQYFWHVGFGISLFSAVLGPQQPQARNVCFATATAVAAATTHGLAGHSHTLEDYAAKQAVSTPFVPAKR